MSAALGPATARAQIALTNVHVVDVESGTIQRDRTILIVGGRIASIGAASAALPRGARVLDYRGAYVIPGLWDMHVHLGSTGRSSLPLFIANGVTGVRDMGSDRRLTWPWRDSILAGSLVGPRMLLAGPIVENSRWLENVRTYVRQMGDKKLMEDLAARIPVSTPESAVQAVDSIITLGGEFLKIRNDPPPPAMYALLRHARERGLPVAGHWPARIAPGDASDSGFTSLEHGALSFSNQGAVPTLDRMTEAERGALFARFARNGTAYTPTVTSLKGYRLTPDSISLRILADSAGLVEPRRRYVERALVAGWKADYDLKLAESPPLDWVSFQKSWLRDLPLAANTGVLLLAGTDAGSPLVFPGFSVADELEALVVDGHLTPLQSLRTATLNVARWMKEERTSGSVAAGKRADLVLLDSNPLTDITALRRIRAVVREGRVHDRAALDSLLRIVRRDVVAGYMTP
jgi:hypothetical protein